MANTESGNACPTSAVSASATVIDDDRQQQRYQAGHQRAEHEKQHDQRGREPESELAVAQVLAGERREVAIERELAGDRDVEAGVAAGASHGADGILDVVLGVAAERHQHRGGALVAGDQPPLARVVEGVHLDRAGPPEVLGEGLDTPPEPRLIDRRGRRAHDDDLGRVRRVVGEAPVLEPVGAT